METEFDRKVSSLLAHEPRYHKEAYRFIANAVSYTVSKQENAGHVSASTLLGGSREFATVQYGVAARLVLEKWGLKTESDVGNVVYLLIKVGLLRASEDDSQEEFETGNDLFCPMPPLRVSRTKNEVMPFLDL